MFGSCKLLLLLIYFVFEKNVVTGSPAGGRVDGDGPPGPPVDDTWKLVSKHVDTDRLKLNQGNAVQEENFEPAIKKNDEPASGDNKEVDDKSNEVDDKKDEKNDGDEKKEEDADDKKDEKNDDEKNEEEEGNGGKDGDGEDEGKKPKEKEEDLSFMMKDITASLNWPLGIVPYYLDSSVFDYIVAYNLRKAMDLIESVSCIQFKTLMLMPTSQNSTWINFTNPAQVRECVHEREEGKPGEIVMVLGFDCMKQKQILHTLLHAIGFKDEVTHPLRDQYVRVIWDNIQPNYLHLFRTAPNEVAARAMHEYDPVSIMHFHDRAYSKNGQATIQPLLPGLQIGPTNTLSALDKLKIRTLFGHECSKRKVAGLQESCKNIISKKLKSPDNEPLEALKFEDKDVTLKKVENTDKGKKKEKKKRSTTMSPSMEEREKKMKEIIAEDDPRNSEGN